jgi:hypothetical protein
LHGIWKKRKARRCHKSFVENGISAVCVRSTFHLFLEIRGFFNYSGRNREKSAACSLDAPLSGQTTRFSQLTSRNRDKQPFVSLDASQLRQTHAFLNKHPATAKSGLILSIDTRFLRQTARFSQLTGDNRDKRPVF